MVVACMYVDMYARARVFVRESMIRYLVNTVNILQFYENSLS